MGVPFSGSALQSAQQVHHSLGALVGECEGQLLEPRALIEGRTGIAVGCERSHSEHDMLRYEMYMIPAYVYVL